MSKLKLLGAFEIGLEAFICKYLQNGEKFAKGVVSSAIKKGASSKELAPFFVAEEMRLPTEFMVEFDNKLNFS